MRASRGHLHAAGWRGGPRVSRPPGLSRCPHGLQGGQSRLGAALGMVFHAYVGVCGGPHVVATARNRVFCILLGACFLAFPSVEQNDLSLRTGWLPNLTFCLGRARSLFAQALKKAVRKGVSRPRGWPEGWAPRVWLSPPQGRPSAWPLSCVWEFPMSHLPGVPDRWTPGPPRPGV